MCGDLGGFSYCPTVRLGKSRLSNRDSLKFRGSTYPQLPSREYFITPSTYFTLLTATPNSLGDYGLLKQYFMNVFNLDIAVKSLLRWV